MSSMTREAARVRASRRAVIRAAAWSVPVIAVAAPAPVFAASNCVPVTLAFDAYPVGTQVPNGTSQSLGQTSVQLNYSGPSAGTANNATIYATTSSSKELRFYDANTPSTSQTITFTFSRPVTNLTLSIIDIDQSTNYDDRIVVNTGGFSYTRGASVRGIGTSGDPFRSSTGTAVADGSAAATLALTWAAAVSFVSVTYQQGGGTTTGSPHIGIKSAAFTPTFC